MSRKEFPVWNEKYESMGVTPRELYMRQNKLCWLVAEVDADDEVRIFCTDGKDKAQTNKMLNPTFECAVCMASFAEQIVRDAVKKSR